MVAGSNHINGDDINNIRQEISTTNRNKNREYVKYKINEKKYQRLLQRYI
jgi:hypothetical protein